MLRAVACTPAFVVLYASVFICGYRSNGICQKTLKRRESRAHLKRDVSGDTRDQDDTAPRFEALHLLCGGLRDEDHTF